MSYFEDMDKSLFLKLTSTNNSRLEDINFQLIQLDITNNELSPLAEYYTAPFIFKTPETCIIIPLIHIDINDDALRQLICHFQSINLVTSNGNSVEVRLENLKPESKEMFNLLLSQNKINPFILDLYQFQGEPISTGDYKYVKLINNSVNNTLKEVSIHNREFDEIWRHIKQVYSDKKYIHLYPNWVFSDSLANLIILNYFSIVCKEVYLCVDNKTSRIIELTLSNDR